MAIDAIYHMAAKFILHKITILDVKYSVFVHKFRGGKWARPKLAVKICSNVCDNAFFDDKNLVSRSVTNLCWFSDRCGYFCGLFNDRCVTVHWAVPNLQFIRNERIYGVLDSLSFFFCRVFMSFSFK